MLTRRAFALRLGGRFLVKTLVRRYPTRFRFTRETRRQVEQQRLIDMPNAVLDAPVSDWFTKPARDLNLTERLKVRVLFAQACNMPAPMIARWMNDPRILDGYGPHKRLVALASARRRLRAVLHIKERGQSDGSNWSDQDYDAARECIFVVQGLFHPHFIDYETWVVLRNYGREWERKTPYEPGRKLPLAVARQAARARLRHAFAGTPPDEA